MHLSGQLTDWSISDLLQIMQVTTKTGSLDIDGERRGRVHFRDGRVTGAELSGARGTYLGDDRSAVADVLYVLATLKSGSFSVGPADGPEGKGWSVDEIMGEVDALTSLEGEVVDAGLFEADGFCLVAEIDEAIAIEPGDWHALVTLVPPFTFGELESRHGRGTAVRVFHTLHRLGMAEPIMHEDEGESEWLGRLAEDVAPGPAEPVWVEHPDGRDEHAEVAEAGNEFAADAEPLLQLDPQDHEVGPEKAHHRPAEVTGVSAPASTTLTDGVYDEIRRLRSRVSEK